MNLYLLQSPIVLVPVCLLVYFTWKRFFMKENDRKIVSELFVISLLLLFCNYIWSYEMEVSSEPFRLHGNF